MPPCSALTPIRPTPSRWRRKAVLGAPPFGRFRRRPEAVEIVARGLGKFKEFAQQVFRAGKRDVQVARLQGHARQQVGQFPADSAGPHGDLHARCRLLPAQLIDGVVQTFFAPVFPLEVFPLGQAPQVLDQQTPVDQESPAGLETAAALHELDQRDTEKGNTARRHDLYQGRFEGDGKEEWFDWARLEMMKVYGTVRAKGRLGGVLRQQLYRLRYQEFETFRSGVEACQAVTERLTQSALDVKTGKGAAKFSASKFFDNPEGYEKELLSLDDQFDSDAVRKALGGLQDATGILLLLQKPSLKTLVDMVTHRDLHDGAFDQDPRVNWYL